MARVSLRHPVCCLCRRRQRPLLRRVPLAVSGADRCVIRLDLRGRGSTWALRIAGGRGVTAGFAWQGQRLGTLSVTVAFAWQGQTPCLLFVSPAGVWLV